MWGGERLTHKGESANRGAELGRKDSSKDGQGEWTEKRLQPEHLQNGRQPTKARKEG